MSEIQSYIDTGQYDKANETLNRCLTLLPKDKWDIPFDGWITEKEIHRLDK